MKKLVAIFGLVLLLVGGIAFNAAAIPITGAISFAGGGTPDNFDLNLAHQISFTGAVILVTSTSGNYAVVPNGTAVTVHNPLVFDPPAPVVGLWSIPIAGISFDATSMSLFDRGANHVDIAGNGLAHMTGFDNTPGTYIFTLNTAGTTFSFSASNSVVPEPVTLLLLGCGLIGLVGYGRKFRK